MTDVIAEEFCHECHRIYAFWKMMKCLFDNNVDAECLKAPHYEHFFYTIRCALYDACTQGVVRLHDPATQLGRKNLTVDYIVEHLQGDPKRREKLEALRSKMNQFVKKLRRARNRFTAHNDLESLLTKVALGIFEHGEDQRYFDNLEKFASVILGERFIFADSLIESDVDFFMTAFKRGMVPLR